MEEIGGNVIEYLQTEAYVGPGSTFYNTKTWSFYIDGVIHTLDALGRQGWELCGLFPQPTAEGYVAALFKRPSQVQAAADAELIARELAAMRR